MIWDDARIVAFDVEASGEKPEYALQPWRIAQGKMWLTSASAIRYDKQPGCEAMLVPQLSQLYPTVDQLRELLQWVIDNDKVVLGWNLAYDIACLIALGLKDLCMRVRWLDGMLVWRHFDIEPEYEFATAKHKKKRYRLKPEAVTEFIPTFAGLDEDIDFHATDPESLAKLQKYNDRDNVRAWTITRMLWFRLTERQQRMVLIEAECLPLVAEANLRGLPVDYLTTRQLEAKLDKDAARLLADLGPHGVTEEVIRSPTKLGALMFDQWGLPVLKMNKSKVPGKADSRSTDKEVLHELSFIDARVKALKEYRETLNARGKFVGGILNSYAYNGTGHTHPTAFIFGTYTGRMTMASKQGKGKDERPIGYALHQTKRDKAFREPICAEEGYEILEFDAAGQEYRWMAVASGDTTMLGLCLPGEDPHSFMGAAIVDQDYRQMVELFRAGDKGAEHNRYLGKFSNLSLQYRTSARKLRSKARVDYNIPMEMPEAQRIWATYQRTYPGVPVYWRQQIEIVKSRGYVETFGGNRVQVKGDWNGTYGWSMGSTAINTLIQGTGADQKHLAIAVIKDYLHSIGGRFLFDLHDGLYLLIPSPKVDEASVRIKYLLDNLPYQEAWGFTPPIPMPWDCKRGLSWGKLKDVKFAA